MRTIQKLLKYQAVPLLLLTSFILCCAGSQKESATVVEKDFEYINYDWSLKALNGDKINFSRYKNKVLFINIWATWCPPCVEEMPDIQQLCDAMKSVPIEFILASSENAEVIKAYLQKNQITLPVYIYAEYLPNVLRADYIPRTYIIDRYGKIVYKKIGQANWNTQDIKEFLLFLANVKVNE